MAALGMKSFLCRTMVVVVVEILPSRSGVITSAAAGVTTTTTTTMTTDSSLRNVCTEIYLSSFFRKTVLPSLPAPCSRSVVVVLLPGVDGIYGSLSFIQSIGKFRKHTTNEADSDWDGNWITFSSNHEI